YMRTDSLRVADAARGAARSLITERYGEGYVPRTPRVWRAGKGAQDAHEAIGPSDVTILPQAVRSALTPDQYRLYRLIWERFVASQMSSAVYDTVTCECVCEGHVFRASAYNVRFSGFLSAFEHPEEDPPAVDGVRVSHFASFAEGEQMRLSDLSAARHFTEPPPRYNDASLIKMLEESGIGRPSTYTSILSTIVSARSYVKREGKSLVPTRLGEVTTALMKEHFPDVVDVRFTADMETKLDVIEHGDLTPTKVLGDFYTIFEKELKAAETEADSAKIELPPEESEYECEKCGAKMVYKAGRYGRFLACPNYPTCRNTKAVDKNGVPVNREESRPEPAGFTCELCGADMLIRRGRYGQFYACSNYPTCRNTKQKINDTGVTCPLCGGKIVTKYSRSHRLFYSCENYPACTFSSWDEPLAENCPVCGDRLLYKKSKKLVYCRSDSCDYTREEEPKAD
ncbi:MAG: topoisomerase DNA-binding C4 zinc finger domain-containing protein, partial [Clostridia bacterium]|nr:topoisomerase DNA-binding C4 zinc finger domain-containing protein [Clostridia bacterium]